MRCEYDGLELPVNGEGVADACPECAVDLARHALHCDCADAGDTVGKALRELGVRLED